MMSFSLRDPHLIGTLAAAVVCVGGATAYLILRRRPSEEELERERRAQLVRSGRIMDGTIMDFTGAEGEDGRTGEIRLILYKYEIGGVEYECSQDVTTLRDRVRAEELRLSFPCSVRYDVRRPENSIVLAENWSGLRATAQSVTGSPAGTQSKPRSSPAR